MLAKISKYKMWRIWILISNNKNAQDFLTAIPAVPSCPDHLVTVRMSGRIIRREVAEG